jgi:hypothetical protein
VLQENGATKAAENGSRTVAEFFANPPDWLPGQLKVYRENPQTHFKPLYKAVAAALDDAGGLQWEEVADEVKRELMQREGA